MFVGESEKLLGDLVLAGVRGAEHGWVIAIEGDHNAMVEVGLGGMIVEVGTQPGAQVARQTNFDRNLTLGELFDQIGIVEGGKAVTDALGAQVERPPHGFGWTGFASMRSQPQAMVGGPRVGVAEKLGRSFLLVAANADAYNFAVVITNRKLENCLRGLRAELADRVENPDKGNTEVARATGTATIQTLEDGAEILLAPQADTH